MELEKLLRKKNEMIVSGYVQLEIRNWDAIEKLRDYIRRAPDDLGLTEIDWFLEEDE